ncbi:hypothetical protein HDK64DRAFT_270654 [Phyllosticta capitalensis]
MSASSASPLLGLFGFVGSEGGLRLGFGSSRESVSLDFRLRLGLLELLLWLHILAFLLVLLVISRCSIKIRVVVKRSTRRRHAWCWLNLGKGCIFDWGRLGLWLGGLAISLGSSLLFGRGLSLLFGRFRCLLLGRSGCGLRGGGSGSRCWRWLACCRSYPVLACVVEGASRNALEMSAYHR